MPPKKLNKPGDQAPPSDSPSDKPAFSDEEIRQESSNAASASLAAQQKAKELQSAASAAGDPKRRQKLTEEATNALVEAESFGKTAKYLRSGTFQGMAMGTGLGVAPGAGLGAITGTLVGGISSTLLGGLGAGIGAATGALHGPFVNMGKVAGKGVEKMNRWLPEWVVSEEQKRAVEKMVGQAGEVDMPGREELERLRGRGVMGGRWMRGGWRG
ncbi:glycoside hydrolase family 31 [Pyrenophora seminiperda CCB06]|uniref:Glycoside hydrolase family 31 n=1 Tax=Pyrenophora seminiperda CCB06 TaxID=1302712 RepID=A0A3M7M8Z5_9PLEO|nr:glycoside hydrolase family 31 [Pyrenophora seminiperda CCB06]